MAEYIEREALRSKAVYMHGFGNNKYVPLRAIEDAPTVDVAPVVHGRWEKRVIYICNSDNKPIAPIGLEYKCSECGRTESNPEPYCHCGARMDGDGNG